MQCVGCGTEAASHPWVGYDGVTRHPVCARCHQRPPGPLKMHFFPAAEIEAAVAAHRAGRGQVQTSAPPTGPLNAIRWEVHAYLGPDFSEAEVLDACQRACAVVLGDDAGLTVGRRPARGEGAHFLITKLQLVTAATRWPSALDPVALKAALRVDPVRAQARGLADLLRDALEDAFITVSGEAAHPQDRVVVDALPCRVEI